MKGEVNAYSMTDFPELRFKKGETYFLVNAHNQVVKEVTLKSIRGSEDVLILGFAEISTPEEMGLYRNHLLEMDKAKAPVPKGAIRYADIIGYSIINEAGKERGKLDTVVTYSPTANLKVKKDNGKFFYVPFNDFFVKKVDDEAKTIVIHEIEGLI